MPPATTSDPLQDLELLIRSRYALIVLETPEADRAQALLQHLADRLGLPLFHWSRTKGLRRLDVAAAADPDEPGAVYGSAQPAAALNHVEQSRFPAI
ncbi:MAG: hypothetical protein PHF00_06555, partial [Elusimicrobia bacterium]|nr:hypothetical protein [Elusimicrobiota bacterium]